MPLLDQDVDCLTPDCFGGYMKDPELQLSEAVARWCEAPRRTMILGPAGQGKTVAALRLLKAVNSRPDASGPVVETFPLGDWARWRHGKAQTRLSDWIVHQLTATYPEVSKIAATELVREGRILPVFLGLDAVPEEDRGDCVDALIAYDRSPPCRPFVVTYRWDSHPAELNLRLETDEYVCLAPFSSDQILQAVTPLRQAGAGWHVVCGRIEAGDAQLLALLQSPRWLAIAVEVYCKGDPSEILDVDPSAAKRSLLRRVLDLDNSGPAANPYAKQDGAGIAFLAAAMHAQGRRRLWLHDLYLFVPWKKEFLRFRIGLGILVGTCCGFLFGLGESINRQLLLGSVVAAGFALVVSPAPAGRHVLSGWEARLRVTRQDLSFGLRSSVLFGAAGASYAIAIGEAEVAPWLALILAVGLGPIPAIARASHGTSYSIDPGSTVEPRLGSPDDGLRRTRGAGSTTAWMTALHVSCYITVLTVTALVLEGWPEDDPVIALVSLMFAAGLLAMLSGLLMGLLSGYTPWLYHLWLRWRLSWHGLLPIDFPAFLDRCVEPSRGWLRVSDAYEFRHPELMEYLATCTTSLGFPPGEHADDLHSRGVGDVLPDTLDEHGADVLLGDGLETR